MKDPIRWHFRGLLEASVDQSSDPFLRKLQSWAKDEDHRPQADFHFEDLERYYADTRFTPADQIRGFYYGGQVLYKLDRFDDALAAFEQAEALRDPADKIDEIGLLRYRALAAHRTHDFERSNTYYTWLIALWDKAPASFRKACLVEDGDAFLCNLYRMKAQALLEFGHVEKARDLLTNFAMPLIHVHQQIPPTPISILSTDQGAINWRALSLYVPWQLVNTIQQQIWSSHERWLFANDYDAADELIQDCISQTESLQEVASALPLLFTLRAELMSQRCRFAKNPEVRDLMCFTAYEFLDKAKEHYSARQDNADQKAYHLALQIAELELHWIDLLGAHRPEQGAIVISRVAQLQREALAGPTAPFKVIAARLEWLMGTIEADREYCDPERFPQAFEAACAHFQHARDMLVEAKLTQVPIMLGILADLDRLERRDYWNLRDRSAR